MNWTPDAMDRLERAITESTRIQISRHGAEYVLIPREIDSTGSAEVLLGTTVAGDDLRFRLDEIDRFSVIR